MENSSLQVTHIRSSNLSRIFHDSQSPNHVLHIAFNNLLVAAEKRFDGQSIPFAPGRSVARTLYLPARSALKGWSVGQVDFLRLEITPRAVQTLCEQAGQKPCAALRPATPVDDPITWHLACILKADLHSGNPGGSLLRDSIQALLVHRFAFSRWKLPDSRTPRLGAISPARLRAVYDFISSHLHQEIRLAELAAVAGLSLFHFTRAFKVVAGLSPYQYVVEQRLLASRRLLEATNLSIGEIASAIGFSTLAGFAASFRRKWGVSPSSYRRSTGAVL